MKRFRDSYLKAFRFENYISGACNEGAVTGAWEFVEALGAHKILAVCGSVGCGKSHIAGGIGNEVLRRQPTSNIQVMWPELDFGDDWALPECDLLIADDIDALLKPRSRFLRFVQTVGRGSVPVIMTMDDDPMTVSGFEEVRLSLPQYPQVVTAGAPDLAHRLAIASALSMSFKFVAAPDVQSIARTARTPREIENWLIQLDALNALAV